MMKLKFTQRPMPVLAEHRTLYKISQILLVLHLCGRAEKCSLLKLHLFNWALKSERRLASLKEASRKGVLTLPVWGFDPALAIALKFALEDQLVTALSTGVEISAKGQDFLSFLLKDKDLLSPEKTSLRIIGKGISEKMVDSVAKGWDAL
ncbi:MAG: hypothetical protein JWR17_1982 [Pseudomonas sp.]|nr:hypothetical protein [Pseudomonas sp.]